jgi:hypothetical protein
MSPDTPMASQLSQVIAQAVAPAFILGALAAFTAVLVTRQNRIIDRTISLNGISDGDSVRSRLKADLPRLLRRARMAARIDQNPVELMPQSDGDPWIFN